MNKLFHLLEKIVDWGTDKFVGVVMALALIVAMSLGLDTNIITNIVSGLLGYMSKTAPQVKNDR